MIKGYKEEILITLGIYELRELARNVGVSSPTTKKRKQLEQEILKISKGEMLPEEKKTKKGRPPKSIKKLDKVIDVFIPKELLELTLNKKESEDVENIISFNANSEYAIETYEVGGYLRMTLSGYYYFKIIGDDEIVSVPDFIQQEYQLTEGDKIEGKARKVSTDKFYVLENINRINRHQVQQQRNFLDINNVVLKNLPIKNLDGINEGDNIVFISDNYKEGILKIKKLIIPIESEYKIVVLAPNISVYNKLFIEKDLKADVLLSLVGEHPSATYEQSINACNYVDILLKEGNKVIFVVLDIFGLLSDIETFFSLENERAGVQSKIEANRTVKKIFNYGKVIENDASVTVLSYCLEYDTEHEFFKCEMLKKADKILRI